MSSMIKVRVLVDKEKKCVVFTEAGSDFVDVLFSFLTLPLGCIIRRLSKKSGLGSLDNLYESVEQLDPKHLQTEACKGMLLNPPSAAAELCEDLKIEGIHDPWPRSFYTCSQYNCLIQSTCYYTYSSKGLCSLCGKQMDNASEWAQKELEEGGIFVNDKNNFMITDDLRVISTSLPKGLSLFKEMQIKKALSTLEETVIYLGTEEILNLLGRSLTSNNALTRFCFPDAPVQASVGFSLPIEEEVIVNEAEEGIKIKLVLNREKSNVLCAEVGGDFVNLMFSLLTFPLGSVFTPLSNNTSLSLGGCIKNLYSSAESMDLECFKSEIRRNMLLTPKLPTFYGCNKNQILQLEEITSKTLMVSMGCPKCYFDNGERSCAYAPCQHGIKKAEIVEWNPKSAKVMAAAGEAFTVSSTKYMVSDNLQVSPISIISAVGNGMNLSISDMLCKEVSIDKSKARSLLGAMLISETHYLRFCLVTYIFCLMQQPSLSGFQDKRRRQTIL